MDRNDVAYDPERVAQLTAAGLWNDDVLIDWLDRWAEQTPDRIALLAPDDSLTYAQLRAGVARVAGGLRALDQSCFATVTRGWGSVALPRWAMKISCSN